MTFHRIPALTLTLALAACGTNTTATLVTTSTVDPGEDCASGGTMIATGADTNGDGTLQSDEITDTKFACNGADGLEGTPGGNGADGDDGTDGVLFPIEPTEQPASPAGAYTVDASGGNGSVGYGGDGGDWYANMDYGSAGGHIKTFSTGTVDASFTAPANVATYLGPVPYDFTTTQTIPVRPAGDHTGIGNGQPHMHAENDDLFLYSDSVDQSITGIHIASGVTLTFPLNYNVATYARLDLSHDIHNEGTIRTARQTDGLSAGGLSIDCGGYYGATGSIIDLSGADNPSGTGGDGGYLDIDADAYWSGYQDLGSVFNYGTVDTSGGSGLDGGDGDSIYMYGEQMVINTGALTSRGGRASTGTGGSADDIYLETSYGKLWNSGDLDSSGGDGFDRGGDADYIYFYVGYIGEIRNTGDLTARGGNVAAGCTTDCYGGDGDYVEFYMYGGDVRHNGSIDTRGGSGGPGYGGYGGDFNLYNYDEYGWQGGDVPPGSHHISGNIDLSGGDGGYGGDGGDIEAEIDVDVFSTNQEIVFYGYTAINLAGGNGATDGGDGGDFECYNEYFSGDAIDYGPSGGCINYSNLDLTGGNGTSDEGGNGGDFYLESDDDYMVDEGGAIAYNAGDVDATGGNGATYGGRGGYVWIYGYHGAENHGEISTKGGNASNTTGYAGDGDEIYILSDWGEAINTAKLDTSGGNATGTGGYGGDADTIEIAGNGASNTGALYAHGGNGGSTSGYGGDGYLVNIYGTTWGTTNTATTIDVGAGTGFEAGEAGEIHIGGMNMTGEF